MIRGFLVPFAGSIAATPSAAPTETTPEVHNAWVLFATVAALLAIFFGVVALTALTRWRRNRTPPSTETDEANVDAWEEAGRRAEPYPRKRG